MDRRAVVVALATSVWLGFFAYRHVEYSSDLCGASPLARMLRASCGLPWER